MFCRYMTSSIVGVRVWLEEDGNIAGGEVGFGIKCKATDIIEEVMRDDFAFFLKK